MFSPSNNKLFAVADGEAIPLDEVPNEAYASKTFGDGFAVEPISGTIYSPVTGKIENVTDAKQAYKIHTDDGLDVLVHIGVETIKLASKGFISLVEPGDIVHAGDVIAKADVALIKASGYSVTTPVIIANPDKLKSFNFKLGWVRGGKSPVMTYKKF